MTMHALIVYRGVRQGGVSSSFLYIVSIKDLTHELSSSRYGSSLGNNAYRYPTLDGTITLVAASPTNLKVDV